MKLISMNCPDCGASLNVKDNAKKVTCEYCGGQVIIQEPSITVNHVQHGDITEEQAYKNAETYLNKLKDYVEAYKCYKSLSKKYVDDPMVWIGLLRSYSNDFTRKTYDQHYINEIERIWNNYISLASQNEIDMYKPKYEQYISNIESLKPTYETGNKYNDALNNSYQHNHMLRLIIILFFGGWGVHKFLDNKPVMGVVYILTFGLFGIGIIVDLINEFAALMSERK